VVPLLGRSVAAVVGTLLVAALGAGVIGTLIVPRVGGWLTSWVLPPVVGTYRLVTSGIADYRRRDRLLAGEAASILIAQLVGWLTVSVVGFALLFWPFVSAGVTSAFAAAGSSLFTLGFAAPAGGAPKVIVCIAAATGFLAPSPIADSSLYGLPRLRTKREVNSAML
jgi:hypothetical protein